MYTQHRTSSHDSSIGHSQELSSPNALEPINIADLPITIRKKRSCIVNPIYHFVYTNKFGKNMHKVCGSLISSVPLNHQQALLDLIWKKEMDEKMEGLVLQCIGVLVDSHLQVDIIGSK